MRTLLGPATQRCADIEPGGFVDVHRHRNPDAVHAPECPYVNFVHASATSRAVPHEMFAATRSCCAPHCRPAPAAPRRCGADAPDAAALAPHPAAKTRTPSQTTADPL